MAEGGSSDILNELQENLICALCIELLRNPKALPCQHGFCYDCLKQHLEARSIGGKIKCPLCCSEFTVPENGIDGVSTAFYQASQLQMYNKYAQETTTEQPQAVEVCMDQKNVFKSNESETNINCKSSSLASLSTDLLATMDCQLDDEDDMASKPLKLTASKLKQFSLGFAPAGVACTPAGNIVVCQCGGSNVSTYSPDGQKVFDLNTPIGTKAWDVECTHSNIYVTDSATESVLAFTHDGKFDSRVKINNIQTIAGISKLSNYTLSGPMYITGRDNNVVIEAQRTQLNNWSTQHPFATGVKLQYPLYICARGNMVAISSNSDHCVHVTDLKGNLNYTYGTLNQSGSGPNKLYYPNGLAFDSANRLFIANHGSDIVCVLSRNGTYIGQINLQDDNMKSPYGITITDKAELIVTSYNSKSVCIYQYSLK